MAQAQSFYERHSALTWWFVMARIGQGLRGHYKVPRELPPELLTLVTKFDDSDWLLPSLSWSNDRGLEVEMKVVRLPQP
jgi:hypothetical protein